MPAEVRVLDIGADDPESEAWPGLITLIKDNWNDWWEYRVQYQAHYMTWAGASLDLGPVKVAPAGLSPSESPEHPLEVGQHERLPPDTISLGQTEDYYAQLGKLPNAEREEMLNFMFDIVHSPHLLNENLFERVVRRALLRDVSRSSVLGEFRDILEGRQRLSFFNVRYRNGNTQLDFVVDPAARAPRNLHALIGTNGVGKTTLLKKIADCLLNARQGPDEPYLEALDEDGHSEGVFSGVQYVSWSAFDTYSPEVLTEAQPGVHFGRVGLAGIREYSIDSGSDGKGFEVDGGVPGSTDFGPEESEWTDGRGSFDDTTTDGSCSDEQCSRSFSLFVSARRLVQRRRRHDEWRSVLQGLQSDPIFASLNVYDACQEEELIPLHEFFHGLSDGHTVVLLSATYLSAVIAERTLVILDEPEAHLHPPLLSAYVRAVSDLLRRKNAVCIVATHSPVVLQEIPKQCAWILHRAGNRLTGVRPRFETFGEDVSALTHEVFSLQVQRSGFYALLAQAAQEHADYEAALASLGGSLGSEGRSILRSLVAAGQAQRESTQ